MIDPGETPAERRFRRETNAVYVYALVVWLLVLGVPLAVLGI